VSARARALLGSAAFLLLAPGVVAGVVPWWLTGWQVRRPLPYGLALQLAGALAIAAGALVLLASFARFALEGLGTPAPLAPTRRLVIGGAYRYVRNPMYLAVGALILGQALLLGQLRLVGYALAFSAAAASFVRLYEEPTLRRRFGAQYQAYARAVPRWWPRLRPWAPPDSQERERS
jgi:protein-S-isoprenylcysteine O-methyltransferase Ste14